MRELSNVLEHAFVMGQGQSIRLDDLTPELRGEEPPLELHPSSHQPWDSTSEQRRTILTALTSAAGNKGKAAQTLGISRTTLWRRMRELKLER